MGIAVDTRCGECSDWYDCTILLKYENCLPPCIQDDEEDLEAPAE
jgi:hypothetical protein